MKLISWNVNGLRAVAGKGFAGIFEALDADFFCLQETKLQAGQLDLEFLGYQSYWNYAEKKGYSGTAIYTRHTPLSVSYGIGVEEHDHEGRVVTLEMPDFYLVNVYTPNSQDGLKRLDYRMQWEDAFRAYVSGLAGRKGVVICGDMNVAHEEIDLLGRSLFFILIYIGFTMINAGFGDQLLAAGSIMMQLLMFFSYFTDGFAYAGEALSGRFIGAEDGEMLRRSVRHVMTETQINELVKRLFDGIEFTREPAGLYDPLRYMIAIGGKRIRPRLCLTAYSFFSDRFDEGILAPASALEVFHSFTLMHDDIMDRSPLRRGVPTVWKKWNEDTAIL